MFDRKESLQNFSTQDREALESLYRDTGTYALQKVRYLIDNAETAQDIVHDAYMKLWEAPRDFSSVKEAYKYIYVMCHNAALDHLRRTRTSNKYAAVANHLCFAVPGSDEDRLANRQTIQMILGRLTPRESQIVTYRAVDGLSLDEMAELLNVSSKTIARDLAKIELKIQDCKEVLS